MKATGERTLASAAPCSSSCRSNTNPALHNNPFSSHKDAVAASRSLFHLSLHAKAIGIRNVTVQASSLLLKRQFYPSCRKRRVIAGGISAARTWLISTRATAWAPAHSRLGANPGDTGKGDPNQAVPKTRWPRPVLIHPICQYTKAFSSGFFQPLIKVHSSQTTLPELTVKREEEGIKKDFVEKKYSETHLM